MSDLRRCPFCGRMPFKTDETSTLIFHDPHYKDSKYNCPLGYLNMGIDDWNHRPLESRNALLEKENALLRKVKEAVQQCFSSAFENDAIAKLEKALKSACEEGEREEILYSGQCNHQIPFGQHCKECNR